MKNRTNAFKNYSHTHNVENLNSFNPELQLKNTKSVIENKLKNSLNELKRLKLVIALVYKYNKQR